MTSIWRKKSQEEVKQTVFNALGKNINYDDLGVLGVPASYLDKEVFNQDNSFLKEAPFMLSLVKNPNHIGCHTLNSSESFFTGTHQIERELIDICAVDILKGKISNHDGYVASGGTEANIQAAWIYRNYFMEEHNAELNEIAILCSRDSHYSVDKAANLLSIAIQKIPVDESSREMSKADIETTLMTAASKGAKYYIIYCNMATTMFGSVDDIDLLVNCLNETSSEYKIHVDGAYGGFYYPFTEESSKLTFENPNISSFTLDAHKMAQSPYGTGIFLIKKGLIQYVNTHEASYVEGEDCTLIGSRSGANAIAVWMILVKHGPFGWFEKILLLQKRAEWLCKQLDTIKVEYYRNPRANIIAIRTKHVATDLAKKYGLVPNSHTHPQWYKVVIMDHVSMEKLTSLVDDLKRTL